MFIATKREEIPAPVTNVDPCDNSNDSGLGFDHHLEFQVPRTQSNFVEHDVRSSNELYSYLLSITIFRTV